MSELSRMYDVPIAVYMYMSAVDGQETEEAQCKIRRFVWVFASYQLEAATVWRGLGWGTVREP